MPASGDGERQVGRELAGGKASEANKAQGLVCSPQAMKSKPLILTHLAVVTQIGPGSTGEIHDHGVTLRVRGVAVARKAAWLSPVPPAAKIIIKIMPGHTQLEFPLVLMAEKHKAPPLPVALQSLPVR